METAVITPEGLARLTEELDRLTGDGRREIAERLRLAVALEANTLESAHYVGVREDQSLLEQRIHLLRERIGSARVVEPDPANGRVDVGERVRVRDLDTGERFEFDLVGPHEADPLARRLSVAAPLGRAVLGMRRGQTVDVDAPRGRRRFKVLRIAMPA
jgi:transcription elongation factor GreA